MSKPLLSFLVIALTFATAVLDAWANADGLRRQGRRATLRFETRSTASMLFRHVDLDLADYQFLIWRWYIEEPIESPLDERTREGDDHPARLFLVFRTATGQDRRMEIIWGNKLKAGDYKYIGGFPHYVADGSNENIRQWRSEEVDLREVYRHIWPTATLSAILPM